MKKLFVSILLAALLCLAGQVFAKPSKPAAPVKCTIVLSSSVPGEVWLNSQKMFYIEVGETRLIEDLPSGQKLLELRNPAGTLTQRINAKAGEQVKIHFFVDLGDKDLVYVEGGSFMMGDRLGGGHRDELPVHKVNLSSFYIGKFEVTQAQFRQVMDYNSSFFYNDNCPAEMLSWYEAIEFCNKLSLREGLQPAYTINKNKKDPANNQSDDDQKWTVTWDQNSTGYRLPTEAEWEYAARGGIYSEGFSYAGTDYVPYEYASFQDESGDPSYFTWEVGFFYPNELGLHDMNGNVYEWCWDWYGNYSAMDAFNPTGAQKGSFRVIRGGCYKSEIDKLRLCQRAYEKPNRYYNTTGMRLVRSSGGFK